jgi:hypothetical protein
MDQLQARVDALRRRVRRPRGRGQQPVHPREDDPEASPRCRELAAHAGECGVRQRIRSEPGRQCARSGDARFAESHGGRGHDRDALPGDGAATARHPPRAGERGLDALRRVPDAEPDRGFSRDPR